MQEVKIPNFLKDYAVPEREITIMAVQKPIEEVEQKRIEELQNCRQIQEFKEVKMETTIKSYKGFNKDMTCRGFLYEEGKEYKEDKAKAWEAGFHGCEYPLDVFNYYSPSTSVYHVVEQSGEISKDSDDSKIASTEIKVGARIGIRGLVEAAIEFTKSHTTMEHTDPKLATAGENGAATAGYKGAATAGNYGAATAGNYGAATAGNKGAATAGNYGAATSRGSSSSGNNGLSVARGNNVKAKGGIGAILVIVEENSFDYGIKEWKAVEVDGETVKADTWYMLKDGELVEAEED